MNYEEQIRPYLRAILTEREWSWALAGAVYIMVALVIRGWFLKPIVRRARELDRKTYRSLKNAYLTRSVWGWLFFFISFLILVGLWNAEEELRVSENHIPLLATALGSFILSILFHIGAFAVAAIVTLRKVTEASKSIS